MSEIVPASPGDPEVLLAAIARAAARLAAQDVGKSPAPLDEAEVEEIVERVVRAAFRQFDIDLTSVSSVAEFREAFAHVRRSRVWWGKAFGAIVTALMSALALGVLAAAGKYLAIGGH